MFSLLWWPWLQVADPFSSWGITRDSSGVGPGCCPLAPEQGTGCPAGGEAVGCVRVRCGFCLCRRMLPCRVGSVAVLGLVTGQEKVLTSAGCGQIEHLKAVEI